MNKPMLHVVWALVAATSAVGCRTGGVALDASTGPDAGGRTPDVGGASTGASPFAFMGSGRATPLTVVRREVNDRGVTVATLSNGLTVIVQENHTVPVVTVQAAVRTGSMDEGRWLGCGLSHLLEHLVAKGATRGEGHVSAPTDSRDRLDEIGAQSNAFTSMDRTTYYVSCASSRANDAIDILADWMARPEITEADFQREHGVVQRELEMGKDDAGRQMWYGHAANFYGTHPAAVPVIGYLNALKSVTIEDVRAYHRQRYVPRNIAMIVVGDVDADKALQRLCVALAGFENVRSAPIVLPEVPIPTGVRRAVLPHPDVKDVRQWMSFRTIPLVHPDLYAMDVLSYVLTNGASSRLHRVVLREKKLVTSISSGSWTPAWGAGQFTLRFRCEPGKADAAEQAILEQLRRVIADGVTAEELDKAKRQKVADYVYSQQSVESQASTLMSDFLSTGDVDFSRQYADRIQRVTAEQVAEVARGYLTLDAMVVTRMVPAGEAAKASAGAGGQRRPDRTERFTLPNGLTVVLHPTDTVDLVAMNLAAVGGVLVEDEQTSGLGTLMTKLSLKGAGDRSAEQIAAFFDRAGGSIDAQCGNNSFIWTASVLKADAIEAARILADVAVRPTYAKKELEILRPGLLAAIKRVDEQWGSQMQRFFRRTFYTNSPYRLLPTGSEKVVAAADPKAIAAYHDKYVKAGSAVLSVFGNFDANAMRQAVTEGFAAMRPGKVAPAIPAARKVAADGERHVLVTNNQVAAVMIGWPGMKVSAVKDRDAVSVLDTIISGYRLPRGWLHSELRGKQLVYVVHAYNWMGLAPGAFVVYAATQPGKAAEVVDIIRRNIARTLTQTFTADQIKEAVNMILTAELLDNQTMASLAMRATLDELYGFGYDYSRGLAKRLDAVTPADLTRVARKYLAGPAVETITTPRPEVVKTPGARVVEMSHQ